MPRETVTLDKKAFYAELQRLQSNGSYTYQDDVDTAKMYIWPFPSNVDAAYPDLWSVATSHFTLVYTKDALVDKIVIVFDKGTGKKEGACHLTARPKQYTSQEEQKYRGGGAHVVQKSVSIFVPKDPTEIMRTLDGQELEKNYQDKLKKINDNQKNNGELEKKDRDQLEDLDKKIQKEMEKRDIHNRIAEGWSVAPYKGTPAPKEGDPPKLGLDGEQLLDPNAYYDLIVLAWVQAARNFLPSLYSLWHENSRLGVH